MRNILLAGAAAAAGLAALAAPALAQPRQEGATDAADSTATRGRLSAGQSVAGALDPAGDSDWYRIRLRAGRMYRFTLDGAEGDGALGDPLLNLYGAQGGDPLAANDDAGGSLNSALSFTPERSGNYFLEARGFDDEATGRYVLATTRGEVPPPPVPLTLGEPVTQTLSVEGERDRYRVALVGGQTYRFALSGSGESALSDPYLGIYNPGGGGDPVAEDDDGGGGLNSYLEFTAPSTGAFIVEARAFNDGGAGEYTLSAHAGDVPADASTDVSLSADGDARSDRLHPASDSDWYRVDLTEGQTVRIKLDGGDGEGALSDPMVIVHGADGAELARDDDGGEGLNSYLEFTAAAAGPHFVEARGFQESAQGGYRLTLLGGEIPATTDSDESVSSGQARSSVIGAAGDADWFRVSMVEGRTYRLNLEGGAGDGDLADPVLALMASDGAQVAEDDDGGTGANAYLSFTAPKSGDYFAAARAFAGDATGRYTLRVSDTEVPGDQSTDESLDGADDSRASRIDFPGDNDAYRVAVEAGARYRVEATGQRGADRLARPAIAVQRGREEIARGGAALSFTAPDGADQVLVVVSGARGATGGYMVRVRRQ